MNVENILKVADAIEKHAIPGLGFNMAELKTSMLNTHPDMSEQPHCGSVACVAGWTNILFGTPEGDRESAQLHLGLDDEQEYELFLPTGYWNNIYTAQEAVDALRHLASTGNVEWSAAARSMRTTA